MIPSVVERILGRAGSTATRRVFADDSVRLLVRGALVAFILQFAGILLRTIMQLFFAREMGVEEFGVYSYLFAWMSIAGVVGAMGLPSATIRFVAEYEASRQWGLTRGLARFSRLGSVVAGTITAFIGASLLLVTAEVAHLTVSSVIIAMVAVPFIALLNVQTDLARSLRNVVLAYSPFHVERWALSIIIALAVLMAVDTLTAESGLIATTGAVIAVASTQALRLRHRLRRLSEHSSRYLVREWIRVSLPLLIVALFALVMESGGIIVVALIEGPEDAGVYAAAARIAALAAFVLTAANAVAVPMLTRMYFSGDLEGVQRIVRLVARVSLAAGILSAGILALLAEPALELLGSAFAEGSWALRVLLVGQVVHASTGPVGFLMMTTGHHREAAAIQVASAAAQLALVVSFTAVWGLVGAAIGSALVTGLWNAWLVWRVRERIGIRAFVV